MAVRERSFAGDNNTPACKRLCQPTYLFLSLFVLAESTYIIRAILIRFALSILSKLLLLGFLFHEFFFSDIAMFSFIISFAIDSCCALIHSLGELLEGFDAAYFLVKFINPLAEDLTSQFDLVVLLLNLSATISFSNCVSYSSLY